MLYCPHCGTPVKEEESYCIKCGKALPEDMLTRTERKKEISKWWMLPILSILVVVLAVGAYSFLLQHKSAKALELYNEAEVLLMEENYTEANELLQASLNQKEHFSQAEVLYNYTNVANQTEEELVEVQRLLENGEFEESIALISTLESKLTAFHGPAVSLLIEKLNNYYALAKLEQLKVKLDDGPSFNELRILIWEADEINHPESPEIVSSIRERIIDYTFSRASEELNNNQFNDAILIAEDGLKYAPDSEKLQSLLTNINKEKLAFEADAKDRMEQAIDTASKEHQINENDAIELLSVKLENNADDEVVIKGEVKSNATVPIDSIMVEYVLLRNDEEILTNEIFVFPDMLYPLENGKFEFTHFDLKEKSTRLKAEVKKITWYTN
ncbi:zinc-ribbon domain-containing protein [Oceanobacillus sp. CAU 1775]